METDRPQPRDHAEDLRAFFDLDRRLLERLSTRVVPCRFGVAYLDDEYPTRYYSNFLLADSNLEEGSPDALIAVADEVLNGFEHRLIILRDEQVGRLLAPLLEERGFKVSRDVVLIHRRLADRPGSLGVEELPFDEIAPLIFEIYREDRQVPDATTGLFTDQHHKFERAIGARFFASRIDGELAGNCELYVNGLDAQVENVGTLERFRGRGVARSVTLRAIDVARAEGAKRVFIVADDDDWPKELYARLGFDEVGRDWHFLRVDR